MIGLPRAIFDRRSGFTLVELLVVITIVGILIALLLPAVQAAREAGRQLQCKNNLKQLALGCLQHEQSTGRLPTGGWGCYWTGDADLGTGQKQPGGWIYNILPYIDQQPLHDLGAELPGPADQAGSVKCNAHLQRLGVPLAVLNCPTRREAVAYPWRPGLVVNAGYPIVVGRTDYAANGGDKCLSDHCGAGRLVLPVWRSLYSRDDAGPATLADGGVNTSDATKIANAAASLALTATYATGIVYRGSLVRMADIQDGTSVTYLAGEKNVSPDWYLTGLADGDDLAALTGADDDHERWTADVSNGKLTCLPLKPDTLGLQYLAGFGSAHLDGVHMAFCDGSVRMISYGVDAETHRRLGNRADQLTIDGNAF